MLHFAKNVGILEGGFIWRKPQTKHFEMPQRKFPPKKHCLRLINMFHFVKIILYLCHGFFKKKPGLNIVQSRNIQYKKWFTMKYAVLKTVEWAISVPSNLLPVFLQSKILPRVAPFFKYGPSSFPHPLSSSWLLLLLAYVKALPQSPNHRALPSHSRNGIDTNYKCPLPQYSDPSFA